MTVTIPVVGCLETLHSRGFCAAWVRSDACTDSGADGLTYGDRCAVSAASATPMRIIAPVRFFIDRVQQLELRLAEMEGAA